MTLSDLEPDIVTFTEGTRKNLAKDRVYWRGKSFFSIFILWEKLHFEISITKSFFFFLMPVRDFFYKLFSCKLWAWWHSEECRSWDTTF